MFGLAVIVFIMLFRQTAGYGQHYTKKWGFTVNNKLGWVLMEVPTVIIYGYFFYLGYTIYGTLELVPVIFLFIWNLHYLQRTFVFPLLIRGKDPMPITIVLMGVVFNGINGYLQAYWIYILSPSKYTVEWILTLRFIVGLLIFFVGFFINLQSDHIIRNLRPKDETRAFQFKIPKGGMFKYVSCPSYLGEILEWTGWAIATWSLAGLVFPIWTFANLAPRAIKNHKWYQEQFADYPKNRKALIPGIL
jgi:3-oxo-5-alpha-steroid 4-dehydrogenase 1